MKPLKTLVLAACLVGAVTSFAGAKDKKYVFIIAKQCFHYDAVRFYPEHSSIFTWK